MKLPEYSGEYYVLIPLPIFLHCIASFLTLFILGEGIGRECIPLSSFLFDTIGVVPAMIVQGIFLVIILMALPVIYKCVERPSWKVYVLYSAIIVAMGFDAMHDIFEILNHPYSNVTFAMVSALFSVLGGVRC